MARLAASITAARQPPELAFALYSAASAKFDSLPGPRLTSFLGALDDPDLEGRERAASAAFRERIGTNRGAVKERGTK